MSSYSIVTEDIVSTEALKKIVSYANQNLIFYKRFPAKNRRNHSPGNGYIKKNIRSFNDAARYSPYIILTDLDDKNCPKNLLDDWINFPVNPNFIFRIAVREIETWLIADKKNFSNFLGISMSLIPAGDIDYHPELKDPKLFIFNKVNRNSRKNSLKRDLIPIDSTASIGPGYNTQMKRFIDDSWNIGEASLNSESLRRAIEAISRIRF